MKTNIAEEELKHLVSQQFLVMAHLGKILSKMSSQLSKVASDTDFYDKGMLEDQHRAINPVVNYLINYFDSFDGITDEDEWMLKILQDANKIEL